VSSRASPPCGCAGYSGVAQRYATRQSPAIELMTEKQGNRLPEQFQRNREMI